MAQKSAEFIDEQLALSIGVRCCAETELADFKQRSGLTDLDQRCPSGFGREFNKTENATQLRLVESFA